VTINGPQWSLSLEALVESQGVQTDSERIIQALKETLRKVIRDPSLDSDSQMENAVLLIDLQEPPDNLLKDIFDTRRKRLRKDMVLAIQKHQALQQTKSEETPAQGEQGEGDEKQMQRVTLLSILRQDFISPFCMFAESFRGLFIGPLKKKGRKNRCFVFI
jgi:hypothetical protein